MDGDKNLYNQFTAAAYELKSPLVLIRQLSFLIQDQNISDDKKRELASKIQLTAEKSLRLASSVDMASANQMDLIKLEPINPLAACDEVINQVYPLYQKQGKKIYIARQKPAGLIVADRKILERILALFADNAVNYIEPGDAIEIKVSQVGGSKVRIGVRDFGPRVARSQLKKSVKSEKRALRGDLSARQLGGGLSLNLAAKMAENINAKIGFIQHKNCGVTFFVELDASGQMKLI